MANSMNSPLMAGQEVHATEVYSAQPVESVIIVGEVPFGNQDSKQTAQMLLPFENEGKWHYDLCDRCCTCTGECWMAFCCACISLGQISDKLKLVGEEYCLDFNKIVGATVFLVVLGAVVGSATGNNIYLSQVFVAIVCFQLRGLIRKRHNIPGGDCEDCLCSWFCTPCTLTQMVGQMWARPEEHPGCQFSSEPANFP